MALFDLPMYSIIERTDVNPFLHLPKSLVLGLPEEKEPPKLWVPGAPPEKKKIEKWGYGPLVIVLGDKNTGLLWNTVEGVQQFLAPMGDEDEPGRYVIFPIPDEPTLRLLMKDYEAQKVSIFAYNPQRDAGGIQLFGVNDLPKRIFLPS